MPISLPDRNRGVSLVELIIFIVIVSLGVAGILSVFNVAVRHSADPMLQKQAQALAEGLLEEVQTAAYAYCDGADANLFIANSDSECTVIDDYGPDALVSGGAEPRPYDTVKDYGSASGAVTSIAATDMSGSMSAPSGYSATVTVTEVTLQSAQALLIRVAIDGPGEADAVAEGYKVRYVPL